MRAQAAEVLPDDIRTLNYRGMASVCLAGGSGRAVTLTHTDTSGDVELAWKIRALGRRLQARHKGESEQLGDAPRARSGAS